MLRIANHQTSRFYYHHIIYCGPGSVVGIAIAYGLDGPGIELTRINLKKKIPVEARFSAPVQTGSEAHPASCTMGTGSFPRGKLRPGRDADPSPPSSPEVKNAIELYFYSP